MKKGFYAFDSRSGNVVESVHEAIRELGYERLIDITAWDSLSKGSTVIIQDILDEIDKTDVFCADLTTLNPNVLFELGYALSRQHPILITIDTTMTSAVKRFNEFALLSPVRYTSSVNSEGILDCFRNWDNIAHTLYDQLLKPHFLTDPDEHVLYLKPRAETNANRRVTRYLASREMKVHIDDPNEVLQSLPWYAREVFNSSGVLCHFLSSDRLDAEITNARYGFIAGLALGQDKQLLMLAESGFNVPFDYKLLLQQYKDTNHAGDIVSKWFQPLEDKQIQLLAAREEMKARSKGANELRGVFLGQVVAEQEVDDLVEKYFVETSTYRDAVEGRSNIFVGRRGVGKSATFLKLYYDLSQDPKCFVCRIKPESYELSGLIAVIESHGGVDTRAYALQSLWKYLLLAEMAAQLFRECVIKPPYSCSAAETALIDYVRDHERLLKGDFATRLEDAVSRIAGSAKQSESTLDWRESLSQKLHGGPIRELTNLIAAVLNEKVRVAVLIDNLDKAWDSHADFTQLTEFVLALLSVASDISNLFSRRVTESLTCNLTLTLFLRSDILHRVRKSAREGDKINYRKVEWSDRELLLRVVEERYEASLDGKVAGAEFWRKVFADGYTARDTILRHIYPRPRDLLFCVRTALETATNRNQPLVRAEDLEAALSQYSRFALDSVMSESMITGLDIESIANEFVGSKPFLSHTEVTSYLRNAGVESDDLLPVVRELCLTGFLGLFLERHKLRFIDDIEDYDKSLKLAKKYALRNKGPIFYAVRRSFWPFLEIEGPP